MPAHDRGRKACYATGGLRNEGTGVVPAPGAVSEKIILPGALNSSGSPAGRLGETGPDNSEASRG